MSQRTYTLCTQDLPYTKDQLHPNQIRLNLQELSVINALMVETPGLVTFHLSLSETPSSHAIQSNL